VGCTARREHTRGPGICHAWLRSGMWGDSYPETVTERIEDLSQKAELLAEQAEDDASVLPGLEAALNAVVAESLRLGHDEDRIEAARNAVRVYRRLAVRNPDAFLGKVAAWQLRLGAGLVARGRPGEGLSPLRDAVRVYRKTAAVDPEHQLSGLVASLAKLGKCFVALSRPRAALAPLGESIALSREFCPYSPQYFRPILARTLVALGHALFAEGQIEEARAAAAEGVEILWEEITADPSVLDDELSLAVELLAVLLQRLWRPAEAIPILESAIDVYRPVAAGSLRLEVELARLLGALRLCLSKCGRYEDAVPPGMEAVERYRRIVETTGESVLESNLAHALYGQASTLSDTNRPDEALGLARESAAIYEKLLPAIRSETGPRAESTISAEAGLANAELTVSILLHQLGDNHGAEGPAKNCAKVFAHLATVAPARFESDLVNGLVMVAGVESSLGRPKRAIAPCLNAVEICRRQAVRAPTSRARLAVVLANLGIYQFHAGDRLRALASSEEALEVYSRFAEDFPALFDPELNLHLVRTHAALSEPRNALESTAPNVAFRSAEAAEALLSLFFETVR
jgi:tetratricopeptide (TPR) repeat protein